jgi:hypothetical protein
VAGADLGVTVVGCGTLASLQVSDLLCRFKGKGNSVATIKWVIDDGEVVKKGDRLLMLDACVITAPQAGRVEYYVPEHAMWGGWRLV